MVTGQFTNRPTHGQSSRGLVNSWTSQLAKTFHLKFGVYNSSEPQRVIPDRLHYLYAADIRQGYSYG